MAFNAFEHMRNVRQGKTDFVVFMHMVYGCSLTNCVGVSREAQKHIMTLYYERACPSRVLFLCEVFVQDTRPSWKDKVSWTRNTDLGLILESNVDFGYPRNPSYFSAHYHNIYGSTILQYFGTMMLRYKSFYAAQLLRVKMPDDVISMVMSMLIHAKGSLSEEEVFVIRHTPSLTALERHVSLLAP